MNVPTEVTLQSSQGVSVEGRYGTRMMFTLADGRVMYVPPIVAGKIEASGIIAGERFQLCKAAVKTGQRRSDGMVAAANQFCGARGRIHTHWRRDSVGTRPAPIGRNGE